MPRRCTAEALARVPPEGWAQLRFEWHPSVRALDAALERAADLAGAHRGRRAASAALRRRPLQWLLWRHELTTYFRSLAGTEAAALDAARSGWPFGELCELLCEEVGDAQAPRRRRRCCAAGSPPD